MDINKERKEARNIIQNFIGIVSIMTLKEVANEIDHFRKSDIEYFERKKSKYALVEKKFIQDEINRIEERFSHTDKDYSPTNFEKLGYTEAINDSSISFKKVCQNLGNSDYYSCTHFLEQEVLHVCKLYKNPNHFLGVKVKELSEIEIHFEGIMYVIWGINSCFYLKWLYGEMNNPKKIISQEVFKDQNKDLPITLLTNLTSDNLKKLHKELNGKYIKKISENDFIYWLTGEPINNGMEKIQWLKEKTTAVYLFEKICLGFTFQILNKCVEKDRINFADNNRSKVEFPKIEAILDAIK